MKNRLPVWFRQEIPDNLILERIQLLSKFKVKTVCCEAKCPNLSYCFKNLKLTFMILGSICTRNCKFCNIRTVPKLKQSYLLLDDREPYRISQLVKILDLNYVVITSVSRDDFTDGGASQFAKTIELIHGINKDIKVEVLIPDFQGKISSIKTVLDAGVDVIGHNIETVKRLHKELKPKANYRLSLNVLDKIKELNPLLITKSSIILGLGETEEEVIQTMQDLRYSLCDILILGQYLSPSEKHYPVKEFISIEQFEKYQKIGLSLGFKSVLSGPKVRSSYRAEEVYKDCLCMI